jgi:hypothetical protein
LIFSERKVVGCLWLRLSQLPVEGGHQQDDDADADHDDGDVVQARVVHPGAEDDAGDGAEAIEPT